LKSINNDMLSPDLNRMSKMPERLPTDISSIRKIGIKDYQNNFFWPVSDNDFFLMDRFLSRAFVDLYRELDREGRDIVLSDSTFIRIIARHLHAMAVSEFCRARNIDLIVGPQWESYLKPYWGKKGSDIENTLRGGRWSFKLGRIAKNIAFNSHLNIRSRIKGHFSSDGLSLGSASRLRQEYLVQNNLFIDNHYWSTLLGKCNFGNKVQLSILANQRIKDFICVIGNYCAEKLGIVFDERSVFEYWIVRLTNLNTIYNFLLEKGPSSKHFLFTETAQPVNKLVAHAFRRKGTKVVAFHHGNDMGGNIKTSVMYSGPSSCDEFVCPISECADSFRLKYQQTEISKYNKTEFTSTETEYYRKEWKELQLNPFPEKIQKVMIIGYPMTSMRYFDCPGLYFYFQLDLELRLVSLLKAHGFKVLYKIHPEVMTDVKNIFDGLCDRVISEPFEIVWHEADAFITKYSASTTFGFALCTNRPIFFIDLEKGYWNHDHYEKLRKRCQMIDAWMNKQNRIEFDEDKLIEGLSSKPEYPDFSYIRKYMFPLET
jgi:hypothetical protein